MPQAQQQPQTPSAPPTTNFDAIIVGAGLAGIYMLYRLRNLGLTARIYEAGDGVGGTWYWNRYPGARCDTESMEYSYSFSDELQQEWHWTERYPRQPEIMRYINHVTDRFDLRRDIQFCTRVTTATYDESANRWTIETERGDRVTAQFCIMATGCLSVPQKPKFPGLDTFEGRWYHTGNWPHEEVDFTGQRVAVIGTGSSAIQSIPIIAQQAAHLTVFQRTPNFSIPAHNGPLDPEFERYVKANYADRRQQARESPAGFVRNPTENMEKSALEVTPEERQRAYDTRWNRGGLGFGGAFIDVGINLEANDTAAEYVRAKIRGTVHDPNVAELLTPQGYPIGTKRLCVDSHYYETYNRDNVTLVDLRQTPIESITPRGIKTTATEYAFDSIVFAIGFDAMTGPLLGIDIRGRDGVSLRDLWAAGPHTYLGIGMAGFPNLFTITGPGSPSVLSNMIVSIEQHVEWVTDCIDYLLEHDYRTIEPTLEAQEAWVAHVNEVGNATLYPRANSWYMGANIPGKPRVFMPYIGGVGTYRQKCAEITASGYTGFTLTP
ncbi:MAG: NAD(P)/FAD-dependent oxidoreductase [Thermomicrobiales bacterium]